MSIVRPSVLGGPDLDEDFGTGWIRAPEIGILNIQLYKNEKSYKATCSLTGLTFFVLMTESEADRITQLLKSNRRGNLVRLRNYITKLAVEGCLWEDLSQALNKLKRQEYKKGRNDLKEELSDLLGL